MRNRTQGFFHYAEVLSPLAIGVGPKEPANRDFRSLYFTSKAPHPFAICLCDFDGLNR
jgi:hypothetical protein